MGKSIWNYIDDEVQGWKDAARDAIVGPPTKTETHRVERTDVKTGEKTVENVKVTTPR